MSEPEKVHVGLFVCLDCPTGGRGGSEPMCPNVEECDKECVDKVTVCRYCKPCNPDTT